ncbi:MAG: glycerate kinase [Victivallales bacterium]|nr:glycerate kinase [Victivallales bacterium]
MSVKKIVIAPDSFKGTLRATQVCNIWRRAFQNVCPEVELVCLPMADGGEGSLEAVLAATGAKSIEQKVGDPLGRTVSAHWALLPDGSAFIEAAEANGIERITAQERNPLVATTYGVGQLINAALGKGAKRITIGIGGSATVDGGAGMLQALGYRLLDENGSDIAPGGAGLAKVKSVIPAKLPDFELNIACDVVNPLLGELGTCHVFAPQKGATPEMVETLEQYMRNYADVMISSGVASACDVPGDGAAGGLGFALRGVLGGKMHSGARLIAGIVHLREHLNGASLLITGEGCSDEQTLYGKLPAVVAEIASEADVPAILCSGAINDEHDALRKRFKAVFGTLAKPVSLQEALDNAEDNLYRTACSIAAILTIAPIRKIS